MTDNVLMKDIMMKRAIMKSRFTIENYKSRWFILTADYLTYHDGTIEVSVNLGIGKFNITLRFNKLCFE